MSDLRSGVGISVVAIIAIIAIFSIVLFSSHHMMIVNSASTVPALAPDTVGHAAYGLSVDDNAAGNPDTVMTSDTAVYYTISRPIDFYSGPFTISGISADMDKPLVISGTIRGGDTPLFIDTVICSAGSTTTSRVIREPISRNFEWKVPCNLSYGLNTITIHFIDGSIPCMKLNLGEDQVGNAYGIPQDSQRVSAASAVSVHDNSITHTSSPSLLSSDDTNATNTTISRTTILPLPEDCTQFPRKTTLTFSEVNVSAEKCHELGSYSLFKPRQVIYNYTLYTDDCIDNSRLQKYYCNADGLASYNITDCAASGMQCRKGACVSNDQCDYSGMQDSSQTLMLTEPSGNTANYAVTLAHSSGAVAVIKTKDPASSAVSQDYAIIDQTSGKTYTLHTDPSSHSPFATTTYSFGESTPNPADTNPASDARKSYIVKFTDEPLAEIYAEYRQSLATAKASRTSGKQSGQSTQSTSSLQSVLAIAYASKIATQRAAISETAQQFEDSLQREGMISSTAGITQYKNVFAGVRVSLDPQDVEKIRALPNVAGIYEDAPVHALLDTSVPLIRADKVWKLFDASNSSITGRNITIGIIDTGVDYKHPDLGGCFGNGCKVAGGYNFVSQTTDPMDDMGHGTHVASIAAGNGVLKGVAPDATIYAYKVLDSSGSGSMSDVISGIERAMDPNQDGDFSDHLDVISLSLGHPGGLPTDPDAQAIDTAVDAGVVAVVAAGNDGADFAVACPGCAERAITVGATDRNDTIAPFSSRGPTHGFTLKPDVSAPGVNICAAQLPGWFDQLHCKDNMHIAISGTSMATPHVAGVAALLLQKYPDMTPQQIKSLIMETAVDAPDASPRIKGTGRVDAYAAATADTIIIPEPVHVQIAGGADGTTADADAAALGNISFTITNTAKSARGYRIVAGNTTMMSFNKQLNWDVAFLQSAQDILCVTPLSTKNVTFGLQSKEKLATGFYSGVIRVQEFDSCTPQESSPLLQEYRVPYDFKKLRNINITFVLRDLYTHTAGDGVSDLRSPTIIITNHDASLYFSEHLPFIYNGYTYNIPIMSDDNLSIAYLTTAYQYAPDANGGHYQSYQYIFMGEKLPAGIDHVLFDEHNATELSTNFDALAASLNMMPYHETVQPVFADVEFYNIPYSVLFAMDDIQCGYFFRDHHVYVSDNGFFSGVFLSLIARESGASTWMRSPHILALDHFFSSGESSYNYSQDALQELNISWNDALHFDPLKMNSAFSTYYNESVIIMNSYFGDIDYLNESELPKTVQAYLYPQTNIFTLAHIHATNSLVTQTFVTGTWGGTILPTPTEISFFKPPLIAKYLFGTTLVGYLNPSTVFISPKRIYDGLVLGPYDTLINSTFGEIHGTPHETMGEPLLSCQYPSYSNPPFSGCINGQYTLSRDFSDFVKNGTRSDATTVCLRDSQWFIDTGECT